MRAMYAERMRDQGFVRLTEWVPENQRWELVEIARRMREGKFGTGSKDGFVEDLIGEMLLAACAEDEEVPMPELRNRLVALDLTELPSWHLVEKRLARLLVDSTDPDANQTAAGSGSQNPPE